MHLNQAFGVSNDYIYFRFSSALYWSPWSGTGALPSAKGFCKCERNKKRALTCESQRQISNTFPYSFPIRENCSRYCLEERNSLNDIKTEVRKEKISTFFNQKHWMEPISSLFFISNFQWLKFDHLFTEHLSTSTHSWCSTYVDDTRRG